MRMVSISNSLTMLNQVTRKPRENINLPVLSLGLSVGWMSPTTVDLKSSNPTLGEGKNLDDEIISWLGSLQFLGGVTGVLFWGQIAERFGRKPAGYLLAIPIIVGWTIVLFAPNSIFLMAGRFIMGLSGTGSLVLAPLYVSELSEDSYRGTLGSFLMIFFNLGVLLAYVVGAITTVTNLTIFCDTIPIIFLCCFYFLPESPVYLWAKGNKEEAKDSLLWFRNRNHILVERELAVLDTVINSSKTEKTSVPLSRLYDSKGTVKGMIIGFALYFIQQFCGILVILTYTADILVISKWAFSKDTAAVIMGTIQVFATWMTSVIIDRVDRKILMTFSNMGMFLSLTVGGTFFYLQANSYSEGIPNWTPFACMCVHVIAYSASASMAYIVTSEVLTPEIRPLAFSITSFLGTFMAFTSVKIYSTLVSHFGMHGNFWFFSIWCFLATVFTIFFIPETRGKPLVEVLKTLNGSKSVKKNNKVVYEVCNYEMSVREQQC